MNAKPLLLSCGLYNAVTRNLFRGCFLSSLPSLSFQSFLAPFLPLPLLFPPPRIDPSNQAKGSGAALLAFSRRKERHLPPPDTFTGLLIHQKHVCILTIDQVDSRNPISVKRNLKLKQTWWLYLLIKFYVIACIFFKYFFSRELF